MADHVKNVAQALCSDGDRIKEEDRGAATKCLNLASKCQNTLSKCLKTKCKPKEIRRGARLGCRDILKENYIEAAKNCKTMCHARVLGVRHTTVSIRNAISGEEESQTDASNQPKGLSNTQLQKWEVCMDECKLQQAMDSLPYKKCLTDEISDLTRKCGIDKCGDVAFTCLREKCEIDV